MDQITVRLKQEGLMDWLKDQAKKENRSLNNYIETVLNRYRTWKEDNVV